MRRWWRVVEVRQQGEGVSGSCRHLFVWEKRERDRSVQVYSDLYIPDTLQLILYPSSLTSPPDFSSTQNWRDQVIKLVSGSLPTERSIYSLTQYVISWVISPPLYRVPVSVQSTSDCQPTERRVKLSSLRATLDWQTSAGLCSDSVITRGSVCCDQSAKHQHGMQIFSNTKVIICHWLKNTCFGGKPKKL